MLFDIEEVDAKHQLDARWTQLDESARRSGAPRFWGRSADETRASFAKLLDDGVRWLEISWSIGMNGWIFSR